MTLQEYESPRDYIRDYANDPRLGMFESSLVQLVSSLKMVLPTSSGMFDVAKPNLEPIIEQAIRDMGLAARDGRGPRATTMRQIAALFPEKDIENYIVSNLPKQFATTRGNYESLTNYISETLKEAESFESHTHLNWFRKTDPTGLNAKGETWFHGNFPYEFRPGSLQTGFYFNEAVARRYGHSVYNGRANTLVLKTKKSVYVHEYGHGHYLWLYVPVEGIWVQCQSLWDDKELPYFDQLSFLFEYDRLLTAIGFQKKRSWSVSLLFNFLDSLWRKFKLQPLPDHNVSKEFHDIMNRTNPHCQGPFFEVIEESYDLVPKGAVATTELLDELAPTISKRVVMNLANNSMYVQVYCFERVNGTLNYGINSGSKHIDAFDIAPFRVAEQIVRWLEDIICKVGEAANNQSE
jgi:hypothetical protein